MSEAPIPKLTPEERAELRGKLQFAAVLGVDPFASIPVQSRKLAALLDENEAMRRELEATAKAAEERRRRAKEAEGALGVARRALRRIGYEPFGDSEASHREVLEAVTDCARAALAGSDSVKGAP